VDVILLYRRENLNTVHCLSLTLLSACSEETHSACLMNSKTAVGYVVWLQTERGPLTVSRLETQELQNVSTYFLLPHHFQIIIPSRPISRHTLRHRQSFRKIRRQRKLSGQPQAPASLLPVKETPFPIGRETG
jgi:hypothetical protein